MTTRTTRLPADLLDAAEAEAIEEHRSTSKQVEHWARFGMYFDQQTDSASRRIRRAIAGVEPLADLTTDERAVANALIDSSISTEASDANFADRLAARGVTTVLMDDDGRMIRRLPDGSTTVL